MDKLGNRQRVLPILLLILFEYEFLWSYGPHAARP